MRTLWRPTAACALFAQLAANSMGAQASIRISDKVACTPCRVIVGRSVDLTTDSASDQNTGVYPNGLFEDPLGGVWVLGSIPANVFTKSGKLARRIGREGKGPGEYLMMADAQSIAGDSVVLLDPVSTRISLLDRDFRFNRSITLPQPGARFLGVIRWPDSVVVSGWIRTPASAGFPLHLFNFRNAPRLVKSFGSSDGKFTLSQQFDPTPFVHVFKDGRILSADVLEYNVSLWRSDGTLIKRLERRPEWFAERSLNNIGTRSTPPPPRVAAIAADSNGLVWVFTNVSTRTWPRAWDAVRNQRPGEVQAAALDFTQLFRTEIEVLDPSSNRVIARAQIASGTAGVLPGMRLVSLTNDRIGSPILRVIPLTLSR